LKTHNTHNKHYSYDGIHLWEDESWRGRVPGVTALIEYMQTHDKIGPVEYTPSFPVEGDLHEHPLYRAKTHGIDDPAVVKELNDNGLEFLCTGQGQDWWCICPKKAIETWSKLPVLIFFDKEDQANPLWTMKSVTRHQQYIQMLTETMDFVLITINITNGPDTKRIYLNILQEASCLFPCDISRFYINVSTVADHMKLKEVPGFVFNDQYGNIDGDPDSLVKLFGTLKLPVLNMAYHWGNCDSLEKMLILHNFQQSEYYEVWKLVHTEVGKRMANDMKLEMNYSYVEDPKLTAEMEAKGLIWAVRRNACGERYIVAAPRQQFENGAELPVVLYIQETYEGNEHLPVSGIAYAEEWFEIAAQGQCVLVMWALEDIVSNDRIIEVITQQLAPEFHIDLTRVYVTGHSHDGYFAYSMANRNPEFVTAISVMGMYPCPFGMNEKPDYTKIDEIKNHDIPAINLIGLAESRFPEADSDLEAVWIPTWQHVMLNYNCRVKTTEEILAAYKNPANYTQAITKIPGDQFRTFWAQGHEHYIVDFVNSKGKIHLRTVRSEDMPHTITPIMCTLSWDFLRRYKKNPQTQEIIELDPIE
jgi:hypothetical protein